MKLLASLVIALFAAYMVLVLVLSNLDAGPSLCDDGFTLPALACRFGALGLALLLVPVSGVLAFFAARKALAR